MKSIFITSTLFLIWSCLGLKRVDKPIQEVPKYYIKVVHNNIELPLDSLISNYPEVLKSHSIVPKDLQLKVLMGNDTLELGYAELFSDTTSFSTDSNKCNLTISYYDSAINSSFYPNRKFGNYKYYVIINNSCRFTRTVEFTR